MSVRTWDVHASAQISFAGEPHPETGEPTTRVFPVVTQEDLIKAVVDGAVVVDRAGGCLAVAVQRIPTGVPNEMVTTRALVTWQDRTNAKPQPEPSALEESDELVGEAAAQNGGAHAEPQGEIASESVFDDGLVVDPNAVDESDVPASMRGS